MSLSIRLAATAVTAVALVGSVALPASADGNHWRGHHRGHHGHHGDNGDHGDNGHHGDHGDNGGYGDNGRRGPRSNVEISEVQYNSPGFDNRSNRSLNGEWFTVKNEGRYPVQLRNHTVRDEDGHTYRFGWLRLRGGQEVTVHTGYGRDGWGHVYQDSSRHLYDNRRGSVTLRDDEGRRLDRCEWNRWDGGHTAC